MMRDPCPHSRRSRSFARTPAQFRYNSDIVVVVIVPHKVPITSFISQKAVNIPVFISGEQILSSLSPMVVGFPITSAYSGSGI